MKLAGKSNVLILGILAGALAIASATLLYMEEQERHKRVRLEQRVAQLSSEKDQLERDLDLVREEKTQLQEDVAAAQEESRRLTARLNEVTQSQAELQGAIAEREQSLGAITKELEQVRGEREQLNRQLASIQDQSRKLEHQLTQLKQERSSLQSKLAEITEPPAAVELEKVVVTSEGMATIPPPQMEATGGVTAIAGRVLVVNREYDFIVMNVGKANGVKLGDEFEVWRDSRSMGRVKVEKIYEALSAAALLPGTDKQQLREGDTVRSTGQNC